MDDYIKLLLFCVVIALLIVGGVAFLDHRDAVVDCQQLSQSTGLAYRVVNLKACYLSSPDYGWVDGHKYVEMKGIQAIREGK